MNFPLGIGVAKSGADNGKGNTALFYLFPVNGAVMGGNVHPFCQFFHTHPSFLPVSRDFHVYDIEGKKMVLPKFGSKKALPGWKGSIFRIV